jgi:hypothetical protein
LSGWLVNLFWAAFCDLYHKKKQYLLADCMDMGMNGKYFVSVKDEKGKKTLLSMSA